MRDYEVVMPNGSKLLVAQAPTSLLQHMLSKGFEIVPGANVTKEAGRARMQLELEIRALGLGEVD